MFLWVLREGKAQLPSRGHVGGVVCQQTLSFSSACLLLQVWRPGGGARALREHQGVAQDGEPVPQAEEEEESGAGEECGSERTPGWRGHFGASALHGKSKVEEALSVGHPGRVRLKGYPFSGMLTNTAASVQIAGPR